MSDNKFLFYESYLDSIEQANKYNKGYDMAKAILEYGLYGSEYEGDDPIITMGLAQIKNDIDRTQLRYDMAIANGSTGGRPPKGVATDNIMEMLRSGMTQIEVANALGLSVRTIQRRVASAKNGTVGPKVQEQGKSQGEEELAAGRSSDLGTGTGQNSNGTWEF